MSGVTFDSVTKRFDDTVAVDSLELEVADGEFLVLLGPSGCGKTTALRMIAGLEEVTEGKLWIGDRVVNDVEPRDRDLAMVFQSYALYPHMTVRKNIESPLLVRTYNADGDDRPARKLTKAERGERIDEAARMLGLEPYLDRKPAQLSGGQRQRVALARAVVARPGVLLMDEPLSNLDAKLRSQTRAELVDLHRRFPATVVYVTHDQVEAMTMAQRIAVMAAGQLQQVGTPRDIYERPANLFVAQFIGTPPMNTVSGAVSTDLAAIEVGESRIPVPSGHQLAPGAAVTVGVRPEHLVVAPTGPVKATVSHVEWLGHEALLACDLEGVPEGMGKVTVRLTAEQPVPDVGAKVALTATAEHVHLFDAQTTERL